MRTINIYLRVTEHTTTEVTAQNRPKSQRSYIIRNQPVTLRIGIFRHEAAVAIMSKAELEAEGWKTWLLNISKNHTLSYPVYIQPDYDFYDKPITVSEEGIISVVLNTTDTEESAKAIKGMPGDMWEAELTGFAEEDTALETPLAILQWPIGYVNRVADENADAPGLLESTYYTKEQINELLRELGQGQNVWGQIGGDILDQEDLISLLNEKADLVDGKVPSEQLPAIPDKLSDLESDITHRTVTDAEKTAWNNKLSPSALDEYATKQEVEDALDDKQDKITEQNKLSYNLVTDTPSIPSKTSDLTNDSDFQNRTQVSSAISSAISNKADKSELPTKTSDLTNDSGFQTKSQVEAAIATASEDKADKATTLAGYGITDAYTKTEVDAKVASVFHYKGSVESYANLPASGMEIGDVYNVVNADMTHGVKAGDNVAWNGTAWDVLAGEIDLSGYVQKTEKGAANGVASLGNDGKVPPSQLPTIPSKLSDLSGDSTHRTVTDEEKASWNGKSDFNGDYNSLSNKPTIPSKTSDLTNDSGFQTASDVQTAITVKADLSALTSHTGNTTIHVTAAEKEAWNAKSDFSGSYNDLTNKPTIPSKTSDLTNDSGFQTANDVSTAISSKANASDLTSHTGNTTIHVTAAEKETWNGKSDFSGDYDDLTNKPDIPAAQVQANWNESSTTSKAYIQNKPTIPTQLSQLTDDATHRVVTDTEKTTWNGKADSSALTTHTGNTDIHVTVTDKTTWNGKLSGVSLNGEAQPVVNSVADIASLAIKVEEMPDANDTVQKFILYLGETDEDYTKCHLYERKLDSSAVLVPYDRVVFTAYGNDYVLDAQNGTGNVWSRDNGAIQLKYEQIDENNGWWEFTDFTSADSGYEHNLHTDYVDSTVMPWDPAITGWYHEGGNKEVVSLSHSSGEEISGSSSYEWVDLELSQDAIPVTEKGAANGVATLGQDGTIPTSQLPKIPYSLLTGEQLSIGEQATITVNDDDHIGTESSFSVGEDIDQSEATASVAVGSQIDQPSAVDSMAIGAFINQQQARRSLAVGVELEAGGKNGGAVYFGKYNSHSSEDNSLARITGGGDADDHRRNIEELSWNGDFYITGGHQQGVTFISSSVTGYDLSEGSFMHFISSYCTYTLPFVDVPNPSTSNPQLMRTREVILDVVFLSPDASVSFVDSSGNEVAPLSTPEIKVKLCVCYLCRFTPAMLKWVILPVPMGEIPVQEEP